MSFGSQPSNLTFYVGCDNEREECGGQTICLRRGNQNLVVQGPSVIPPEYSGTWGKDPAIDEAIKDGLYGRIEKIQTLVSTMPFGSKNWAYFITKRDGTYSLVYRERKLYQVTTPPWAPLVDEREILVTKMISPEENQGIWDGKEVDLFMGWNEKYRRMLDRIMRAHNLLRGLDLTFEVLGHVTNSDGEIIGIMTEPAYGRAGAFGTPSITPLSWSPKERFALNLSCLSIPFHRSRRDWQTNSTLNIWIICSMS